MNSVRGAWLPPSVRRDTHNPCRNSYAHAQPATPREYLLEDALAELGWGWGSKPS